MLLLSDMTAGHGMAYAVRFGKFVFNTETGLVSPYDEKVSVANMFEWKGQKLFMNLVDNVTEDKVYKLMDGGPGFSVDVDGLRFSLGGVDFFVEGTLEDGILKILGHSLLYCSCFIIFSLPENAESLAYLYGFDVVKLKAFSFHWIAREGLYSAGDWKLPEGSALRDNYVIINMQNGNVSGKLGASWKPVWYRTNKAKFYVASIVTVEGLGAFAFLSKRPDAYWLMLSTLPFESYSCKVARFLLLSDVGDCVKFVLWLDGNVFLCVGSHKDGCYDILDFSDNAVIVSGCPFYTDAKLAKMLLLEGVLRLK